MYVDGDIDRPPLQGRPHETEYPAGVHALIAAMDQLVRHWRRHGYALRSVLTDNRPEYIAADFRSALAAKTICHVRIPARSPNHNAVVERFQAPFSENAGAPRSTVGASPAVDSSKRPPMPS